MSLRVSRVLHAGYLFQHEDTKILFDPIFENPFSQNCFAFPSVIFDLDAISNLKFDAVFISHFHDDHCSFLSLNLLDRETRIFIYCVHDKMLRMLRELGFKYVTALTTNLEIKIGSIAVTPRRALDPDVDSVFQISAGSINVLNVVDSWIDPDALDLLTMLAPWDMVLWPFQTMRELQVLSPSRAEKNPPEIPSEWFEQLRMLKPRYIVPSSCQFIHESWSWYNHALFPISYRLFENEIRREVPDARVLRLDPSVSVYLSSEGISEATAIAWVVPRGEQNVDYEFKLSAVIPPTSEISKNFAALTLSETKKVFEYCRHGLIEKLGSIDASADSYFEKPKIWKLAIFDHLGQQIDFYYEVCGSNLRRLAAIPARIAWLTEVPISKLFAALEDGESLTSMYVRINDTVFHAVVEDGLKNIDILEDPLVRSLFSGAFGSYQAAQLKKLRVR